MKNSNFHIYFSEANFRSVPLENALMNKVHIFHASSKEHYRFKTIQKMHVLSIWKRYQHHGKILLITNRYFCCFENNTLYYTLQGHIVFKAFFFRENISIFSDRYTNSEPETPWSSIKILKIRIIIIIIMIIICQIWDKYISVTRNRCYDLWVTLGWTTACDFHGVESRAWPGSERKRAG